LLLWGALSDERTGLYFVIVIVCSSKSFCHNVKDIYVLHVNHVYTINVLSQSHIATDGQSVCLSWCRAPAGAHDQTTLHGPNRKHRFQKTPIILCLPILCLETGSSIFAGVFVAAGICLPNRYLAMDVYDFTIPAFGLHDTISTYIYSHFIHKQTYRYSHVRLVTY
jgi:hypothetical protein